MTVQMQTIGTRFLMPALALFLTLGLPAVVANLFLALLCGYILLVALGLRPLIAVAGAVALGFSSYNLAILAAGHNTCLAASGCCRSCLASAH